MKPRIQEIADKNVVGMKTKVSISANTTPELWRRFMPRRKEISNIIEDQNFYAIQVYDADLDIAAFTPNTEFEQWAAVEVGNFDSIPESMEAHTIKGGQFAVFIHKGLAGDFHKTSDFIYQEWLPGSGYELDDRDHFQIMGEKYLGPMDPNSEEEVWIPIK